MAGLNDREAFERELSRPPHVARMMEHAGRYVKWLDKGDKDALLEDAVARLFDTADRIKESRDVLALWIAALEYAARRRPRWAECFSGYVATRGYVSRINFEWRWVKGSQLGRGS